MKLNLLVLVTLLGLIAVGSLHTAQPVNLRWRQACADGVRFMIRAGRNDCQWLELENDRYRFCLSCCDSTEVFERGLTELEGESLTLVSDQGKRTNYRLSEGAGKWFLGDAKGEVHRQELESQPRLHPSPEWLDKNTPLELDVPPSRPVVQISKQNRVTSAPDDSFPEITITEFDSDLSGSRLIQGGRELLNKRSSRGDVERLFGPLNWTTLEGSNIHGTRAQARRGKLLIRVLWIQGLRPDEARVTGFSQEGS